MRYQLSAFVGKAINIGRDIPRRYIVKNLAINEHGVIAATIQAPRSTYTAIPCKPGRVAGRPGAESWSILGSGGQMIAKFAIDRGEVLALA